MKSNLMMNFSVDRENKKINVEREFAATVDKVWAAWTESELLDQWWAPKPWKAETSKMDFREGGHWLYSMVGPEGERHYARVDFESITPGKKFVTLDSFCDAGGVVSEELPQNKWDVSFQAQSGKTLVKIEISFNSLEDIEQIIEMGFKEGFASGLENLDELLGKK